MQVISLTVAAALSFGIGLAEATEPDALGIAPAPLCMAPIAECGQMTTLPAVAVPVVPAPAPDAMPTYGAQAKRFFPLY